MENTSIYDLIIIISADYFSDYLFPNEKQSDIKAVQQIARNEMLVILNGGDNFYMDTDFSKSAINKITSHFCETLKKLNISNSIINRVRLYYEIIDESTVSDAFETACTEILITAARLYWLETELLDIPVSDELLDIVSMIEPYGIDVEDCFYDEDEWLLSTSDWDKYLMSLMDGIDEAPFTIFRSMKTFHSQFDFINMWLSHLNDKQGIILKNYIFNEAKCQLDNLNIKAVRALGIIEKLAKTKIYIDTSSLPKEEN